MVKATVIVKNKLGLHSRPANRFVKKVQEFVSDVRIRKNEKEFNAKSIVKVMSACVVQGDAIDILCDGPDEKDALLALTQMVESGLGEAE